MCGIAGKVSVDGRVDEALVERMCEVIHHRGPDSRGHWLGDGVGIGIQRLAIIDLDTGDQPIWNEDETVVVVQNGEIYNYRELREDLIARGHTFRTKSDTEVIVHLYEEYGDACVEHLRGMFAFAIWDRERERLLLARDRVGKKPLFYCRRGGELWFGSEAKSILQDPAVPRELDLDAIDCFLQFQYVPHPKSAFEALEKLPPGHTLSWQDGRVETKRYWKLSYSARRRLRDRGGDARADPRGAARGDATAAAKRRAARRLPLRRRRLERGRRRDGEAELGAGEDLLDRLRRRRVRRDRARPRGRGAIRHRAPRVPGRAARDGGPPHARLALRRAVRRPVGDPELLPLRADPPPRHRRAERRRRRRGLRGLHALHREHARRPARLGPASARRGGGAGARPDRAGPQAAQPAHPPAPPRARAGALAADRYAMWIAYFTETDRADLYTPELRAQLGRPTARHRM